MTKTIYRILTVAFICTFKYFGFAQGGGNFGVDKKRAGAERIMSYNIRICRGMDNVINYDRTANIIKKVDAEIVALQELDSATNRSNGKITGEELATRLGMRFTFSPAIKHDGGSYGVGLLSKANPLSIKHVSLPGRKEARTLMLVEFKDYYVAVTHLSLADDEKLESTTIILDEVKNISDKPVFVCGDFNDTPKSKPISFMCENFSPLNDTRKFTIPSDKPSRTIDYIFGYNNGFQYNVVQSKVIDRVEASDHLPLFVDVITRK